MPPASLFRSTLRSLVRRPVQTGLMVLGVALGVGVVVAIDLANTSATRAFDLSAQAVVGRATHRLVGGSLGVPEDVYRWLRLEWGLRTSAPVVEGMGVALDADQRPLRIIGLDPLTEAPFRDYFTQGSLDPQGYAAFYTRPEAALISADTALQLGLQMGDGLRLLVNGRIEQLTVLGLLTPQEENVRRGLEGVVLMDVAAAQELLGMVGRLSRIDMLLTPDQVEALQAALPGALRIIPASDQAQTLRQISQAFQLNLTALSLVALVVGMFLIYNTMMFNVVQRRGVLGTMRALGMTAGQLLVLILTETALVSLVGALLGVGLGWALGRGTVRLVSQTINDLYYVLSVGSPSLTIATALKGIGLGVLAGLLGAAVPALEASSVAPVTALIRSTLETRARSWLPWLAIGGGAIAGAGGALLAFAERSLPLSLAGLGIILLGLTLTIPAAILPLMRLAGVVLAPIGGPVMRMAPRAVVRSLSRTGIAIAALTIAVAVTIAVGAMISSFRSTLINWLDLILRADVYISSPGPAGAQQFITLPDDLRTRLADIGGIDYIENYRSVLVESEYGPVQLSVVDGRRERDARLYRFADGTAAAIWARVVSGDIIISEPLAVRHGLLNGEAVLRLRTDRGEQAFAVAGVYYDYSTDRGAAIVTEETYHRFWEDQGLTSLGVFVTRDHDPDRVAQALRARLSGTGLEVQVNRALRQEAMAIFERTFAITGSLRILAVVVAFIGVLSALMALQFERARELATLQALGASVEQLRSLTFWETGLMGAAAGLIAWPIGILLAAILVYVINLRSFGWSIALRFSPWDLVQAFALSVAAALLAGFCPMRRLERANLAETLRQE